MTHVSLLIRLLKRLGLLGEVGVRLALSYTDCVRVPISEIIAHSGGNADLKELTTFLFDSGLVVTGTWIELHDDFNFVYGTIYPSEDVHPVFNRTRLRLGVDPASSRL